MDIAAAMSPETQNILGACAIALGAVYCFFGYRFFRVALFVTGFMMCSVAATYISFLLFPKNDAVAVVASLVAGLAGGFLFFFVYLIGVFVMGASFGALIGAAVTAMAGRELQPLLLIVLGVVGGSLAVLLQKHIIILATSFGGAGGIVSGGWYIAKGIKPLDVVRDPVSLGKEFHAIILCWGIASILGVAIQYGWTGKKKQPDENEDEDEEIRARSVERTRPVPPTVRHMRPGGEPEPEAEPAEEEPVPKAEPVEEVPEEPEP